MIFALFVMVVALSAGVAVAMLARIDSGYLVIGWNGWVFEVGNLLVVLLLLSIGFLLAYWLLRGVSISVRGFSSWSRWRRRRRQNRGQRLFFRGLARFTEANWEDANKLLLDALKRQGEASDYSTPALLALAVAADQLGEKQNRDLYLARAAREDKQSELAVGLLRAEFLIGDGRDVEATSLLQRLQQLKPRHPQVLTLLLSLYKQLRRCNDLLQLLPLLRRQKLVTPEQAEELERCCYLQLLEDAPTLQEAWRSLPRKYEKDPELFVVYLKALVKDGQPERAAALLRRRLSPHADSRLLNLLVDLADKDPLEDLQRVEKLLTRNPDSAPLALTAARLAQKCDQPAQADHYYLRAIDQRADAEVLREYGELLLSQQKTTEAAQLLSRAAAQTAAAERQQALSLRAAESLFKPQFERTLSLTQTAV
ncbi:MAG TPA: hypothetical protein DCF45_03105 [Gammaproteobacteria bacterium]|nr:hypothetical protein [Gammaproteobacteria bacterium]